DGDMTEFIWVNVTAIEGDEIHGELGNNPVDLENLKIGDSLRVKLTDLNDWLYTDGDELVGGFTTKVLMNPDADEHPQ
ncbi:MAG: DUF2314 domain-containing protein, partial [Proteobacteria bacterium]|nr:DUF2314 domain-containing protein [Pseudomonadota bacterium]